MKASEKPALIDGIFTKTARRYDIMNDMASIGLHRLWKSYLLTRLALAGRKNYLLIDAAGGTGDIAIGAARLNPNIKILVIDRNKPMLIEGKKRAEKAGLSKTIDFIQGDAEHLSMPDNTANAYSIAFGLRNITDITQALSEAHRVLKKGGRFFCLEFAPLPPSLWQRLYSGYTLHIVPTLGKLVAGERAPYRYLAESIEAWHSPEALCQHIQKAGFQKTGWKKLSGGIAVLHEGWKP